MLLRIFVIKYQHRVIQIKVAHGNNMGQHVVLGNQTWSVACKSSDLICVLSLQLQDAI